MREVTLEELLEAGCHFGHQVTRHNPKSRDFVFEARDNIHIIDLAKTKEGLQDAGAFVKKLALEGATMVIVGAKRQAHLIVEEEIKRIHTELASAMDSTQAAGIYFITNRWIGGTLTNFSEVAKNFRKLKDIKNRLHSPEEKAKYTKKEIGQWEKEVHKLESFYGGIVEMNRLPDALFIIDTHLEKLAVSEAGAMGVKTVGIVDTNADPAVINYPIPANDDAVGSIKLIVNYIVDAWIEGSLEKNSLAKQNAQAQQAEVKTEEKQAEPKDGAKEEKKEKPVSKKPKKTSAKQNPEVQAEPQGEKKSQTEEKPKHGRKPKEVESK